ncbi:MAG: FG-GAP repeat protein [Planctomycetes bacterium]|nr:FG-GAP repeat protein [Planctomycetota bacterium]
MNTSINFVMTLLAATPVAAQTQLISLHGAAAGDGFGAAIVFVGDTDGDGSDDFAIGSPLSDLAGPNSGRVDLYSGRTSQLLRTWAGNAGDLYFGSSIAGVGDLDGDQLDDVAIGAAGWGGSIPTSWSSLVPGYVRIHSGATGALLAQINPPAGIDRFGYALAGGVDLTGDGIGEILIGAPGDSDHVGYVYVHDGATRLQLRRDGAPLGHNFGFSIAQLGDISGDGVGDYVAGAPRYDESYGDQGFVHAIDGASGARLWSHSWGYFSQCGWSLARIGDISQDGVSEVLAGVRAKGGNFFGCQPWSEVHVLDGANGALLRTHTDLYPCAAYGSSAACASDLDGDGNAEYVAGGPGQFLGQDNAEGLRVFGGAQGTILAEIASPNGAPMSFDAWGFALASGDVNGDGLADLLVGAPFDDSSATNAGAVYVLTIVRGVTRYCASEANSLGCVPAIGGLGTPSATSSSAFQVQATNVLNQKIGFCFYGQKPRQTPFQGGYMCIAPPTKRTPNQSSNGAAPPASDCSGALTFDFNARIQSGVDPQLVAGEEVFVQYWSRDPADASTTNLTDALAFQIKP